MIRTLSIFTAAAVVIGCGSASAQDARPVFRSGTALITVPVRVLQGTEPSRGLTKADFGVTLDGQPRAVVDVRSVLSGDAAGAASRIPELSFSINSGPAGNLPRTVFLVIDAGGLDTAAARAAASEGERLLDRLPPTDLVGIAMIPTATAAVDPTTDRNGVRAALRMVTGAAPSAISCLRISPGEAMLIEQGDERVFREVAVRECPQFCGPAARCGDSLRRDATTIARQHRQNARASLRSLTALVDALPRTTDPKHVVLVTPGFFHESGAEALYRTLGSDLLARTATLSIVQVEGSEGAAESTLLAGGPEWQMLSASMQQLAGAIGADLLRLGTVATRFERLRREMDAYYLLAFTAEPGDLDGEPHRLEVTVRVADVTLHFPRTLARSAPATAASEPDRMAAVMNRPGIERTIAIGVQTTTVRGADPQKLQVMVTTRVPDATAAGAAIAIEVRDGSRVVGAQRGTLDSQDATGVLSHVTALLVAPGSYQLRVGVVDGHGRSGSVDRAFAADLPAIGPVLTSGLIVGQATTGVVRPALDVSTGKPIVAMLELYSVAQGSAPPFVSVTIERVDDPSVGRRVVAKVENAGVEGIDRALAVIDAGGLTPGTYLVRAEVRAGGQASVVSRHVILHAGAASTLTEAAPDGPIPSEVARASAYVERYFRDLSNVVMDEQYQQQVRAMPNEIRQLTSEVLLVRLAAPAGPTAFRDVLAIDGRPLRSRSDRLQRLFMEQQPSAIEQATRIMRESARFNIGAALRTLNVPIVPLLFLSADQSRRLEWTEHGEETLAGRRLARFRFIERLSPTLLRQPGGDDVFAQGEFWIDPQSGAVWRARVSIAIPDSTRKTNRPEVEGDMTVEFRVHDEWQMLVPESMTERYVLRNEEDYGHATYSNFRRFTVKTSEGITREPDTR